MPVYIPTSLDAAVSLLDENPQSHLLTGGTDMMVEVNFNHRHPESVIALRAIAELKKWSVGQESVFIGAGVPYSQMEHGELAAALPALAEAARTVGSPQIRAAGTLGGNLGTCSPAGDSLPVLSALNAVVHLHSPSGERRMPFSEFMVGPKRNARETNEIISGVTIPLTKGWQGYSKVGTRNAMVISVASACLSLNNGAVSIALGSVGPVIIRCTAAESWFNSLAVTSLSDSVATEFGSRVSEEARPIDDHRSTAQYRRHAVGVLATRLLQRGFAS